MSTVSVPDELVAKLRMLEDDERSAVGELVMRVLSKYVLRADPAELLARVRNIEAGLTRVGISEEELAEHFTQWRRRGRPDG